LEKLIEDKKKVLPTLKKKNVRTGTKRNI